jgi:REP element-mobilizing transposase RayT
MAAYRQILYHIIFRTKKSEKTINQNHSSDLYKYIWGIIKNKKCVLYRINGMEDHIHILSDLHPSVALADYIRDIKVSSSKWINTSKLFPDFRGWGIKYCALTYSYQERDTIIDYIKNQQEHHKQENFRDEFRRLCREQGISLDEKWFWEDC